MTGDGPGLDMSLSCSSCAGSGGGLWYSSIEEYWQMCWPQGMGSVGTLGMGATCSICGSGTGGDGWVMVTAGGALGDGGRGARIEEGSENWGGL